MKTKSIFHVWHNLSCSVTPGAVCYDLSLSHSPTPIDKHMLSLQHRGNDTCLLGCTVHWQCVCVFICRQCKCDWSTQERGGGECSTGQPECVNCSVWECLARLQRCPTEREFCLMWPWIESLPHPLDLPRPLMSGGHTEPSQLCVEGHSYPQMPGNLTICCQHHGICWPARKGF